jgi:hypothetical protein
MIEGFISWMLGDVPLWLQLVGSLVMFFGLYLMLRLYLALSQRAAKNGKEVQND